LTEIIYTFVAFPFLGPNPEDIQAAFTGIIAIVTPLTSVSCLYAMTWPCEFTAGTFEMLEPNSKLQLSDFSDL